MSDFILEMTAQNLSTWNKLGQTTFALSSLACITNRIVCTKVKSEQQSCKDKW